MLRGDREREWVAFAHPDFDGLLQKAMERVFKMLDLPRRSDIEALNKNLERVAAALEGLESSGTARPSAEPDA
jgi:hypothetical protein